MRQRLILLIAVFLVMALSNAIVPILPSFTQGIAIQGTIYAAYFFGALIMVLPTGILSDRFGRIIFMQMGLLITILSGTMIAFFTSPFLITIARFIEGIGAGLFVPAAMSWVNLQQDHKRLSGNFMASLNLGLVMGLFGTGWIIVFSGEDKGGIILFTLLSSIPFFLSVLVGEAESRPTNTVRLLRKSTRYIWLYISALILLGTTGVVSAIYPEFTRAAPSLLSFEIGLMYLATIVAVFIASHTHLHPISTLRVVSIGMAIAVLICFLSPIGFILIGGLAGIAIIAQLVFLAETGVPQGEAMGLFNISSYSGMAILPFFASLITQLTGNNFFIGFLFTSLLCLLVTFTIGRCVCMTNEE